MSVLTLEQKSEALKALMVACCPPESDGSQSIHYLAKHVPYTPQGLYFAIRQGKITPSMTDAILALWGANRDTPSKTNTSADFAKFSKYF